MPFLQTRLADMALAFVLALAQSSVGTRFEL